MLKQKNLIMDSFKEAYEYAASRCSSVELCKQDILTRLERFELSPQEKFNLIEKLEKEGFINEKRYVKSYINDKMKFSKWGRVKIVYMLRQKGLPAKLIDECFEETDLDSYKSIALSVLTAKNKSIRGADEAERKNKLYRFAQGRGFESSVISECIKKIFGKSDDEIY